MAKECVITGKRTITGNQRSHSLIATRRNWKPNLQKVKLEVNGHVEKVYVSARALKTLKKAA